MAQGGAFKMKEIDVYLEKSHDEQKINFPFSFEKVKDLAIERWGPEVKNINPSYFPNENDLLVILNGKRNGRPNFHDCFESLKGRDLSFPNVHGLVLLELLDLELNFLEPGSWVLGFDYPYRLKHEIRSSYLVPCLNKDGEKEYLYAWLPWSSKLEHDEYVLLYTKG